MSVRGAIIALSVTGLLVSGCSSRPRQVSATLKTPVSDQTAYDRETQTCQTLVGRGCKSDFRATALKLGAGTAAGIGVSRVIRSGREKRIKTALASCLGEYCHSVDSWTLVKKVRKTKGQKTAPTPVPAIADTAEE